MFIFVLIFVERMMLSNIGAEPITNLSSSLSTPRVLRSFPIFFDRQRQTGTATAAVNDIPGPSSWLFPGRVRPHYWDQTPYKVKVNDPTLVNPPPRVYPKVRARTHDVKLEPTVGVVPMVDDVDGSNTLALKRPREEDGWVKLNTMLKIPDTDQ